MARKVQKGVEKGKILPRGVMPLKKKFNGEIFHKAGTLLTKSRAQEFARLLREDANILKVRVVKNPLRGAREKYVVYARTKR